MKNKEIIFWLLIFCLFVLFLQFNYSYQFYYMEHLQLLLFNRLAAVDAVGQIGGVSLYLSRFLVQFFILPWGGAVIVSLLLTSVSIVMRFTLWQSKPLHEIYLFCLLPAVALFPVVIDPVYYLQGIVAYLFGLLTFWVYGKISDYRTRLLTAVFLLLLLYYIAGPVSGLLAGCIALREYLNKQPRSYISLLLVAEVLLLGLLSLTFSLTGEFRFAFLPDAYADPLIHGNKAYLSWIVWPFCMIVVHYIYSRRKIQGGKLTWSVVLTQLMLLTVIAFFLISKYGLKESLQERRMSYYAYTGQWDKLLDVKLDQHSMNTKMNLVNYALAKQQKLGDEMFNYDQRGVKSLIAQWDNSINAAMQLSDIYFCIGDIASSQKYAFEGYVSSVNCGSGRLLKRLVETNLIFGTYPVAEKYISLLEQTIFYKTWAKEHRRFLYNDLAVAKDPLLGGKRKGLNGPAGIAVSANLIEELELLALNNPDNQTAIQYLAAFYLSNKDLAHFKGLVERYYPTKIWPQLSESHQEAIVFLSPNDRKYWIQHGMSGETEHRYNLFEHDFTANSDRSDLPEQMASNYGNTYWYYLLLKK